MTESRIDRHNVRRSDIHVMIALLNRTESYPRGGADITTG
jgi:hypothetical protein